MHCAWGGAKSGDSGRKRLEIEVGQKATRELTVTAEMVAAYAEITGDYNPLHFDEEFAAATRFGRLMAQGGIAVGLLHALVAMDMPGPGTVFLRQSWVFPAPVYIGDTIHPEAPVKAAYPERFRAEIDFVVTNDDGTEVLKGETTVYQAAPLF